MSMSSRTMGRDGRDEANALVNVIQFTGENAEECFYGSHHSRKRGVWTNKDVSEVDTMATCEIKNLGGALFSVSSSVVLSITVEPAMVGRHFPTLCVIGLATASQRLDSIAAREVVLKEWRLITTEDRHTGASRLLIPLRTVYNVASVVSNDRISGMTRIFITLRFIGSVDGTSRHEIASVRLRYFRGSGALEDEQRAHPQPWHQEGDTSVEVVRVGGSEEDDSDREGPDSPPPLPQREGTVPRSTTRRSQSGKRNTRGSRSHDLYDRDLDSTAGSNDSTGDERPPQLAAGTVIEVSVGEEDDSTGAGGKDGARTGHSLRVPTSPLDEEPSSSLDAPVLLPLEQWVTRVTREDEGFVPVATALAADSLSRHQSHASVLGASQQSGGAQRRRPSRRVEDPLATVTALLGLSKQDLWQRASSAPSSRNTSLNRSQGRTRVPQRIPNNGTSSATRVHTPLQTSFHVDVFDSTWDVVSGSQPPAKPQTRGNRHDGNNESRQNHSTRSTSTQTDRADYSVDEGVQVDLNAHGTLLGGRVPLWPRAAQQPHTQPRLSSLEPNHTPVPTKTILPRRIFDRRGDAPEGRPRQGQPRDHESSVSSGFLPWRSQVQNERVSEGPRADGPSRHRPSTASSSRLVPALRYRAEDATSPQPGSARDGLDWRSGWRDESRGQVTGRTTNAPVEDAAHRSSFADTRQTKPTPIQTTHPQVSTRTEVQGDVQQASRDLDAAPAAAAVNMTVSTQESPQTPVEEQAALPGHHRTLFPTETEDTPMGQADEVPPTWTFTPIAARLRERIRSRQVLEEDQRRIAAAEVVSPHTPRGKTSVKDTYWILTEPRGTVRPPDDIAADEPTPPPPAMPPPPQVLESEMNHEPTNLNQTGTVSQHSAPPLPLKESPASRPRPSSAESSVAASAAVVGGSFLVRKHHASRNGTGRRMLSLQRGVLGPRTRELRTVVALKKVGGKGADISESAIIPWDTVAATGRTAENGAGECCLGIGPEDRLEVLTGPLAYDSGHIHRGKVHTPACCLVLRCNGVLVVAVEMESEEELRRAKAILSASLPP